MFFRAIIITLALLIPTLAHAQRNPFDPVTAPKADRATTPDAPPPIVFNMPDQGSGVLGWVLAAIAALTGGGGVGALFTMALKNKVSGAPVDHDAIRQTIHDALVQVVQSGALAPAVQTGLGFIPGVGGIASQFEPLIRKVALEVLTHGSAAAPAASPSVPADLGAQIKATLNQALGDLLKQGHPASSPPA